MRPPIGGVIPNDNAYDIVDEMDRVLAKEKGARRFGLNKVVALILNRAAEAYPQLLNDVLEMEYFRVPDRQSTAADFDDDDEMPPPPGRTVLPSGRVILGPGAIDNLPMGRRKSDSQSDDRTKTGTGG